MTGSRRRSIVACCAGIVCLSVAACAHGHPTSATPTPRPTKRPTSARVSRDPASFALARSVDGGASAIEAAVRRHYGATLASVSANLVWLGDRECVDPPTHTPPPSPTLSWFYEVDYRLKGLPLTFPLRINLLTRTLDGIDDGAHEASAYAHQDIGGVSRFYLLAERYHHDFPAEPTMAYRPTAGNSVAKQEPYLSLLKGHAGPSVVVYNFDDYGKEVTAQTLGLYTWDSSRHKWLLLYKGTLPELAW